MSQYLIGEIASKERTSAANRDPGSTSCRKEPCVTYDADALFVMIGADANTTWLPAE
jgi:hypothetical protein